MVDSVASIGLADITDDLARASGFNGADDLIQTASHGGGDNVDLIRFHYVAAGAAAIVAPSFTEREASPADSLSSDRSSPASPVLRTNAPL